MGLITNLNPNPNLEISYDVTETPYDEVAKTSYDVTETSDDYVAKTSYDVTETFVIYIIMMSLTLMPYILL